MHTYHIPENEQTMDEIYAVLSVDDNGNEGILSLMTEQGGMPMIFGHERMIELVKPIINKMVREAGRTLKLVKYKKIEVIQEFKSG